nr:RES family NAD+ phosphorylase [uncultured Steroidobacter sp.]
MSVHAFRLIKAKHASTAFSGEGARLVGGRWNLPGTPLVYASESLSLAALETFVHLQPVDKRIRYVWFRITIPANVAIDELASLPKSWRDSPPGEASQAVGTRWAKEAAAPVLRTPSVLVPGEHNLLLNPLHPHFKRLKISKPQPFEFDGRLWKGK